MKYVIFEDPSGLDRVMIFDDFTNHRDIVNWLPQYWKLKSAGKFSCGEDTIQAQSGSVTLGRKFDVEQSQEDTEAIRRVYRITI